MYPSIQCIYSQLFNISEPVSIQRHQSEPQDSLPTPRAYINLFFINIPSLSISYLTITHELI